MFCTVTGVTVNFGISWKPRAFEFYEKPKLSHFLALLLSGVCPTISCPSVPPLVSPLEYYVHLGCVGLEYQVAG